MVKKDNLQLNWFQNPKKWRKHVKMFNAYFERTFWFNNRTKDHPSGDYNLLKGL